MKKISGKIFDYNRSKFVRGSIYFEKSIFKIEEDESVSEDCFVLPGLVDYHVHIESSMVSPFEY